jgi:hypothetical protein
MTNQQLKFAHLRERAFNNKGARVPGFATNPVVGKSSNWDLKGATPEPEDVLAATRDLPRFLPARLGPALELSTQRILDSERSGKLSASQARDCLEMVREVTEGIGDIARGQARVVGISERGDALITTIESADHDQFQIFTCARGDNSSQARIGLMQIRDNGVPLYYNEQLSVRLDLDPKFGAAVDVHFRSSDLDAAIHGVMTDQNGEVLLDKQCRPVTNHHFPADIPPELHESETFALAVESFVKGTLAQLPIDPRCRYDSTKARPL